MVAKKSNIKTVVAGIAGITAAAVGAYYLYGHKDAAKNRAKVKSWMLKAKGEVLEELEKVQDVTEPLYMAALASVAKKYHELKSIDAGEIEEFVTQMKHHWTDIQKSFSPKKTTKTKKK